MNHHLRTVPRVLVILALPVACAKVTTTYSTEASTEPGGTGGREEGSGGLPSSGGSSAALGGSLASGGTHASGGSTLGTNPIGGASSGGAATGGVATNGGASATASGGVTASGGSTSKGGSTSNGGTAVATGGQTSSAGSGPGPSCASATAAFCDDFEANSSGGPAAGWTASSGTWSIAADSSGRANSTLLYANKSTSNAMAVAGTTAYTNATIEARLRVTDFSSNSSSNAAGVFLRNNGQSDYDLSLGGDGKVYLRRTTTSSTLVNCSNGSAASSDALVTVPSAAPRATGWFKLKLQVSGTVAAGVTLTGYIDPTGSSGYQQVLQCTQSPSDSNASESGTAGLFAKGAAPAEYDDVIITTP